MVDALGGIVGADARPAQHLADADDAAGEAPRSVGVGGDPRRLPGAQAADVRFVDVDAARAARSRRRG